MSAATPAISPAISLADLFLHNCEQLPARLSAGFDSGTELRIVKNVLERGIKWQAVSQGLANVLRQVLDIPVSTVLLRAWNDWRQVRQALDRTRTNPQESALVPLIEHKVRSTHHPYIDVLRNDQPIARLIISIEAEFRLKGAVVRIQRGAVQEILSGEITPKGTVKLGEFVIAEKELPPIRLAGILKFHSEGNEAIAEPIHTRSAGAS